MKLVAYQKLVLMISLVIFAGFIPSYTVQFSSVSSAHHFHAAIAFLWLIFINIQSLFISTSNIKLHRVSGWCMLVVAGIFVASTVQIFLTTFTWRFQQAEIFRLVYVLDLFLFPAFVTCLVLAITNRKSPLQHASFITLSTIMLLAPGLGRLIYGVFLYPFSLPVRHFYEPMILAILMLLVFLGYKERWKLKQTIWLLIWFLMGIVGSYYIGLSYG